MISQFLSLVAAACPGGHFLTFPTWYAYLPGKTSGGICSPYLTKLSEVWLVLAAILEILLQVASLVAVGFVVYAGFQFLTSQGEPDKVVQARMALINALVGLTIAVMAAVTVNFIAGSIH